MTFDRKFYVDGEELDPTWLRQWDWGEGVDPEQAIVGAECLWKQIVEDVEQEAKPMFSLESEWPYAVQIAVNILGLGEHHVCFRLDDVEVVIEQERMGIAGALMAVAAKIAAGK